MMKKLFLFAALFSTLSAWSYSLFPLNPMIVVTPGRISAQVYNPYYEPIACSGQAFGTTIHGLTLNAYFNHHFIPAGNSRIAFVQTNPYFSPFINGWGSVWCHFLR